MANDKHNTNIIPFQFEATEVRVLNLDGEPWWVLSDVCKVLGLSNPTVAAQKLDEDERAKFNLGRHGEANTIINESGLWSLVLTSRKPAAKRFKKWITSEVIPSIRKTGGYMVAAPEETPEELALRAMGVLQATIERQKAQLEVTQRELAYTQPKATAFDVLFDNEGLARLSDVQRAFRCEYPELNLNSMTPALIKAGWLYRLPTSPALRVRFTQPGCAVMFREKLLRTETMYGGSYLTSKVYVTKQGVEMMVSMYRAGEFPTRLRLVA